MKGSTGIILVAVGLILLYVVLADKYGCFVEFYDGLLGISYKTKEGFTQSNTPVEKVTPGGFNIWSILTGIISSVPGTLIP